MSALVDLDAPPVLSAGETAALITALVDELIPGGDGWPSASAVGVQGLLAIRLSEHSGEAVVRALSDALRAAGAPFEGRSEPERVAIVERFEAAEPEMFDRVRVAVTLAYYESPVVVDAIRALGRPYSIRPHVTGYPARPFDFTQDVPQHGRGSYIPTDAVKPVDISGLDLASSRTARWGIGR